MSRKWSYSIFALGGLFGWWQVLAAFEIVPSLLWGRWGNAIILLGLVPLFLAGICVSKDLANYCGGGRNQKSGWIVRGVFALFIGWVLPWLLGAVAMAG